MTSLHSGMWHSRCRRERLGSCMPKLKCSKSLRFRSYDFYFNYGELWEWQAEIQAHDPMSRWWQKQEGWGRCGMCIAPSVEWDWQSSMYASTVVVLCCCYTCTASCYLCSASSSFFQDNSRSLYTYDQNFTAADSFLKLLWNVLFCW